jgi:hypothetical protein
MGSVYEEAGGQFFEDLGAAGPFRRKVDATVALSVAHYEAAATGTPPTHGVLC